MVPPVPTHNVPDPNYNYEPIHWMPGGEPRFIVCVILIVLVLWGWANLTAKPAEDEDEDA